MHVRVATTQDWQRIEEMHSCANYGYELPGSLKGLHVAEEDGVIIAAAGYEAVAQIFAVVNPEILSPARRLNALRALHAPMAPELVGQGYKSVFAFCDPTFRGFERRLMRMGWSKKLWNCMFLERAEIIKALG
jgi:hypothetical protein